MTETSRASELAARAARLAAGGDYGGADRLYREAIRREPYNGAILAATGRMHVECGNNASGLKFLLEAREIGESGPEYDLAIGAACNALQRFDEAEIALRRCIEVCPDWVPAWTQLAFALSAMERHLEAVLLFEEAVKETPTAEAFFNRASALYASGRIEDALGAYQATTGAWPEMAQAHFGRGDALVALERDHEAIAAYRAGLKLDPADQGARQELARLVASSESAAPGPQARKGKPKPAIGNRSRRR